MSLSARILRPAAGLLAAAAIPALAACGGSGGDGSADPAALVPARAALYMEANLKPGDDVEELARKLSGEEDPGAKLKELIEKEAREDDEEFSFSEDVDPWLGESVGFFIPRVTTGDDMPAGIVFPTEDPDKAKESLEKSIRTPKKGQDKPQIAERTHKDTEYIVDTADDNGVAIVDDYAVVGSDAAIKAAIDAGEGEALADDSEYEKARDAVEADEAGFMYLRISQVLSGLGPQGAAVRQALRGLGETIAVGLDGDESAMTLESASLGITGEGGSVGAGEVLPQLPAEAWFAAGVADLGANLEQAIEQFSQLGALGGQDPEQLLDQLEAQLGIDPRRDLADWIGDVGFFAFGDTPAEIGGGMVAATKDAAATRRSIPRIATFLRRTGQMTARPLNRSGVDTGVTLTSPQLPLPIHMALTDDDRFIVAVTDAALEQTLEVAEPLGESQGFKDAADELGDDLEPQVFLNFEPLSGLLEEAGAEQDKNAAEAKKVIEKLTTMVAGSKRDGDTARGKVVVGVK